MALNSEPRNRTPSQFLQDCVSSDERWEIIPYDVLHPSSFESKEEKVSELVTISVPLSQTQNPLGRK